jgi:hypothetical protein
MIKCFWGFGFAQTFLDNLSFKKFQLETDEKKNILGNWFFIFISIFFWKFSSVARFGTSFQHFLKYVFRLLQLVLIPNNPNSQTISFITDGLTLISNHIWFISNWNRYHHRQRKQLDRWPRRDSRWGNERLKRIDKLCKCNQTISLFRKPSGLQTNLSLRKNFCPMSYCSIVL